MSVSCEHGDVPAGSGATDLISVTWFGFIQEILTNASKIQSNLHKLLLTAPF
jgi:hypothetical protein